jgi:hypothetical protein
MLFAPDVGQLIGNDLKNVHERRPRSRALSATAELLIPTRSTSVNNGCKGVAVGTKPSPKHQPQEVLASASVQPEIAAEGTPSACDLKLSPFPFEEIDRIAQEWFRLNATKLYDELWELSFCFYVGPDGQVKTSELNRGDVAEVDIPDAPRGCTVLGSLHTHVGCEGVLSDWDYEVGQSMADELGSPYAMYVVGPSIYSDDGAMCLTCEVFEPGGK